MDGLIFAILVQDGVVNGAIYALLALSLVLVFSATRVILIPQGEIVAFGAMTYAALDAGQCPPTVILGCVLGFACLARCLWSARADLTFRFVMRLALLTLVLPIAVALLSWLVAPLHLPEPAEVLLTLAIVVPMAPYVYQLAFRPLADASVLVLLIAAVAVHLVLVGLGLLFFGPEGVRASGFSEARFDVGGVVVAGQSLWVVGLAVLSIALLFGFFELSLLGRALRATAVNRLGARLVGIPTGLAGNLAFALAGLVGTLAGILIVPLTTIYYDTGFVIGLKGFVAAILGGLVSYPLAALGALLVGLVESFSSFWASAFKEVIVFAAIIPVLLVRSIGATRDEDT